MFRRLVAVFTAATALGEPPTAAAPPLGRITTAPVDRPSGRGVPTDCRRPW